MSSINFEIFRLTKCFDCCILIDVNFVIPVTTDFHNNYLDTDSLNNSGYFQSTHCCSIRVVHGSDGPAGRVGSRFGRILAGRVGSGQHFGFFSFLLIISWYQNRCESSNTTFELIDFLRNLI